MTNIRKDRWCRGIRLAKLFPRGEHPLASGVKSFLYVDLPSSEHRRRAYHRSSEKRFQGPPCHLSGRRGHIGLTSAPPLSVTCATTSSFRQRLPDTSETERAKAAFFQLPRFSLPHGLVSWRLFLWVCDALMPAEVCDEKPHIL